MDFKQPFPEKHRQHTGVALEVLLRNMTLATEQGKHLLIRIPMINGYNTDPEDMAEFARILSGLKGETLRIELLRYHEYGKNKWDRLDLPYTVENGFVSDAQYLMFKNILMENGLRTVTT